MSHIRFVTVCVALAAAPLVPATAQRLEREFATWTPPSFGLSSSAPFAQEPLPNRRGYCSTPKRVYHVVLGAFAGAFTMLALTAFGGPDAPGRGKYVLMGAVAGGGGMALLDWLACDVIGFPQTFGQ